MVNVAVLMPQVVAPQQLCMKSAALWAAVPLTPLISLELIVWPNLLASGFLEQPIQHRILYKYNLLVFKAINLSQPPYLSALIRSSSLTHGNRLSISSIRPNKHIGRRGFVVAAPAKWNKLPQTGRSQQTIDGFRSQLKTYLFRLAYPPP